MSGLKARLSAIAQSSGTQREPPRPRHVLTITEHAIPADSRLYALDPLALVRIGLVGSWPGIEGALFLDTETTGLSRGAGTIAFMIGLGYVKDGAFVVEQHTLGDYPDEPLMLMRLQERLAQHRVIVSFNGNAFDLPLLESRAVMCRMPPLFERHQKLDLMHASKRLWQRRLGSCRLSALEKAVLAFGREDDLPGSEVPQRFFDYLKSGDRALLHDVMRHNRLDILSLGSLLIRLSEAYAQPDEQLELADLLSMGRAMERRGESALAERCYLRAVRPRAVRSVRQLRDEQYLSEANLSLSMLCKKAGDWARAERLWLAMARRGQMGVLPLIELAKYYEHKMRHYTAALDYARQANALAGDPQQRAGIEKRVRRLEAKLAARKDGEG